MEGTILARSGFRSASTTQLSSPQPTGLMCVMSASVVGKVYRSPPTYLLGFQGISPKISNNSLANLAIINQATLHPFNGPVGIFMAVFSLAQSACALTLDLSQLWLWSGPPGIGGWGGVVNCPTQPTCIVHFVLCICRLYFITNPQWEIWKKYSRAIS